MVTSRTGHVKGLARTRPPTGPFSGMSVTLPEPAYAAALLAIGCIPAKRLRALLAQTSAAEVWAGVLDGRWDGRWSAAAATVDVAALWDAHQGSGVRVLVLGRPGYPAALADDPDAPAVLFTVGQPAVIDPLPRAAVVGTRSATRYGLSVAAQLGADLAASGVVVVSGMATGIDAAAHEGAVAGWAAAAAAGAPPIGVVGGGLENPKPRGNFRLWERVAEAGAVVSEWPVGTAELPWRLLQRNRIIVGLAEVLVVVESHKDGGSVNAVRAAVRRGVSVGAVPGSVRSPASAGANDLLADGCFVVRDAADVVTALGLARAGEVPVQPRRRSRSRAPASADSPAIGPTGSGATGSAGGQAPGRTGSAAPGRAGPAEGRGAQVEGPAAGAVLAAVDWEPCSLEQLLARTGLPIDAVSAALEQLRAAGLVHGAAGWWERA